MEAVEPYFQTNEYPDGELEEQRQTRENREKIKMSTRCIWCSACMSSCNIAAGDNEYLGPAAINKAYRFAMDEREGEDIKQKRLEIIEQEHGVWRCQTQFSSYGGVSEGHPPHRAHPGAETRGRQKQPEVLVSVVDTLKGLQI